MHERREQQRRRRRLGAAGAMLAGAVLTVGVWSSSAGAIAVRPTGAAGAPATEVDAGDPVPLALPVVLGASAPLLVLGALRLGRPGVARRRTIARFRAQLDANDPVAAYCQTGPGRSLSPDERPGAS